MRCINRALSDTFVFLGGWGSIAGLLAIPIVGMALHWRAEGFQAMEPEFQIWLIYGLKATALVFTSIFTWNLIWAPYKIERDSHLETKAKLRELLKYNPEDTTADFVRYKQTFTLKEAACLLAKVPLSKDVSSGPAVGYLNTLKRRIADKEIRYLTTTANQKLLMAGVLNDGTDIVPDDLEILKEALASEAKWMGVNIEGLESDDPVTD